MTSGGIFSSSSYAMGGNIGTGIFLYFAPFRTIVSGTYAFLVGYFSTYPSTATPLSKLGAFLMKIPLSGTAAPDLCNTYTVSFTSDSNLFETNFASAVAFTGTLAFNHV